jgi:hypothetical protein
MRADVIVFGKLRAVLIEADDIIRRPFGFVELSVKYSYNYGTQVVLSTTVAETSKEELKFAPVAERV